MLPGTAALCRRDHAMKQPEGAHPESLLLAYSAGELTAAEARVLFEAAAADQDLFDQLMEAEAVRHALSSPEERQRAGAVLQTWEHGENERETAYATTAHLQRRGSVQHARLWSDLLRSVLTTVATALSLRLCYAVITALGSSLVVSPARPGGTPGTEPVPSI